MVQYDVVDQEVSMSNVVSVLTQETAEAIIAAGGTEPWTLNQKRASSSDFLVCCRKVSNPPTGEEEVGTAFLIGKIKDVVPSEVVPDRWKIVISEFASVKWPGQWILERKNPVAYYKTEEYAHNGKAIDFDKLKFEPIVGVQATLGTSAKPMSVAQAKAGLAKTFGVDESAIEITIRV
jgi:hypothetical protein